VGGGLRFEGGGAGGEEGYGEVSEVGEARGAMYHPVFADLISNLRDLSRIPDPSATKRALVAQLFVAASEVYKTEDLLLERTMQVMRGLMGYFETKVGVRNDSGKLVAEADCMKTYTREDGVTCVTVVGEFKNEPDGHPDVQAAATHVRHIARPVVRVLQRSLHDAPLTLSNPVCQDNKLDLLSSNHSIVRRIILTGDHDVKAESKEGGGDAFRVRRVEQTFLALLRQRLLIDFGSAASE
jgi:hypothetical protein